LGAVYDAFGVAAPVMAPANLIAALESMVYPLLLLLAGADHQPLIAVASFSPATLSGLAPAEGKYAFCWDVTTYGVLPGLVHILNQSFHQTAAVDVLD